MTFYELNTTFFSWSQLLPFSPPEVEFTPPLHLVLLLFSYSVMSNFLWPHGLQHARLLCPSLSPRVCSNTCPLNHWCYITISSSATLFYFCLHSFRWLNYWSFSISISSSNEYSGLISFRLTGLISLQSSDSQESSPAPQLESISSSVLSLLYSPTLTSVHD